jgi:hypothetical protein
MMVGTGEEVSVILGRWDGERKGMTINEVPKIDV